MADVVHHIEETEDSDAGIGIILGMALVIALVLLLFFWAIPQMGGTLTQTNP